MNPLRSLILAAADNDAVRTAVATAPVTRDLVRRFVAGESTDDALRVTRQLLSAGLVVTLDHLGEHVTNADTAERTVQAYLELLDRLHAEGMATGAEVSVKLSALSPPGMGQALDEPFALRNVSRVCAAAEQAGAAVTVDAEDHTTTDSTLRILAELRRTWPATAAVLQAALRRTEDDCRALGGSRVRLCKGAYAEPEEVAFGSAHEVDRSYVRCANVLLSGSGYPMFATHDPRLIDLVGEQARRHGRAPGGYEYQMLYGVRPDEQRRLAAAGKTVRVYVPYGSDWYGYLMRRLAERPANVAFFLRSLVSSR